MIYPWFKTFFYNFYPTCLAFWPLLAPVSKTIYLPPLAFYIEGTSRMLILLLQVTNTLQATSTTWTCQIEEAANDLPRPSLLDDLPLAHAPSHCDQSNDHHSSHIRVGFTAQCLVVITRGGNNMFRMNWYRLGFATDALLLVQDSLVQQGVV